MSGRGRLYRLVAAGTVSAVGDGMTMVAVPLYATQLTDDPRLVASLRIAAVLPWLMFGLASGVVADRVARRRLMVSADLARAALLVALAVLAGRQVGHILPLCLFIVAVGLAQTLFDSAAQAFLADTVDDDHLEHGIGLMFAGQSAGLSIIGPPLGGLVFGMSASAVFLVDAATFVISGALLLTIRDGRRGPVTRPSPFRTQLADGLRLVIYHTTLRAFAVVIFVVNIGHTMSNSVVVLFALNDLHMSAAEYGVFAACEAGGMLVGSFLARRLGDRFGNWATLRVTVVASALIPAVLGLARSPETAFAILIVDGAVLGVWNVLAGAARTRLIEADMRGRATAVYRVVAHGSMLLGGALGGVVAYAISVRTSMVVGGVAAAAVAVVFARQLRAPSPDVPSPASGRSVPPS